MSYRLKRIFLGIILLLVLTACGGGGASDGGIGGTGITQGRITGFGSIIVNGIKFDVNFKTKKIQTALFKKENEDTAPEQIKIDSLADIENIVTWGSKIRMIIMCNKWYAAKSSQGGSKRRYGMTFDDRQLEGPVVTQGVVHGGTLGYRLCCECQRWWPGLPVLVHRHPGTCSDHRHGEFGSQGRGPGPVDEVPPERSRRHRGRGDQPLRIGLDPTTGQARGVPEGLLRRCSARRAVPGDSHGQRCGLR